MFASATDTSSTAGASAPMSLPQVSIFDTMLLSPPSDLPHTYSGGASAQATEPTSGEGPEEDPCAWLYTPL
ncbi:hypothetical protein MMH89_03060 [Candidatus Comchoanobacter bicostacola]|uniref:Uncharacterized protein n=1 Tax=Candidatus Comchoanobacter bicostacola TaxID=2919598 RepID=A0ABY5DIJ2_9GAMM|nr:hypothetical protein [Candidatus Comchoanobacter bicostacola]UTC24201.1 hypothetical protein MMH89_03060 [Candidatus Comchoanobacter bicostacola]